MQESAISQAVRIHESLCPSEAVIGATEESDSQKIMAIITIARFLKDFPEEAFFTKEKSATRETAELVGEKIKAQMVLKGVSQREICRTLHVAPATVSLIVSGKKKSRRIRRAIAKALGASYESLWNEPELKKAA